MKQGELTLDYMKKGVELARYFGIVKAVLTIVERLRILCNKRLLIAEFKCHLKDEIITIRHIILCTITDTVYAKYY